MTREQATINALRGHIEALEETIKKLEQAPTPKESLVVEDCISREDTCRYIAEFANNEYVSQEEEEFINLLVDGIKRLPSVEPKANRCKDCKHFEYDSVAKVDGIPLIVAHEICNRWGDGCKTNENGYCFLFEPKEVKDGNK